MTYRIVLIDGDEQVTRGLQELIGTLPDMNIIECIDDAQVAYERISELQPDVVIMEIALPGIDGADLCRQLRHSMPHITILLHTTAPVFEAEIQRMGADAIVRKGYSAPRMLAAWIHRHAARPVHPTGASLLPDAKGTS